MPCPLPPAPAGDIDSVLAAIDEFASYYPMYRCGPEKGALLERLVEQQRPALALELGTFMGYGAMRIARRLPPGGRVITVEGDEEQARGWGRRRRHGGSRCRLPCC